MLVHVDEVSVEEFVDGEEFTFDTVCADGRILYENVATYRPRPIEEKKHQWISPCSICLRDIEDPRRFRFASKQLYFKTEEEMLELFPDVPEALENTLAVAEKCNVQLDEGTLHLPEFPLPEGFDAHTFSTTLLERAGVVVLPGTAFGRGGEGFFRIALTVSSDRLREAIGRIGRFIEGAKGVA